MFQYVPIHSPLCDQALWNAAIVNPNKDVVDFYSSLMCYFLQCICHIPELRSSGIWIGPREPLMREEHDIATIPGTFSFIGHMIQMGNCYEFSRRLNARLGKQYLFGSVWNPHEICAATDWISYSCRLVLHSLENPP